LDVIHKVQDPTVKTEWNVELKVDAWCKLKLAEWDKDDDGVFTTDEVELAMEQLSEMHSMIADMKWRFIYMFLLVLLSVGVLGGVGAIVLAMSRDTEVPDTGEIRAENPNSLKPSMTELVVTTESKADVGLSNLLTYNEDTDLWTIDDDSLRSLQVASFLREGSFYNLELAEVIRIDSGSSGNNDKVEMTSTSGVKLRIWESVGDLEVLWKGATMWEFVPQAVNNTGGRLLHDESILSEGHAYKSDHDLLVNEDDDSLPRRLGKGGVAIVGVGTMHGSGGYSSKCQGWCACGDLNQDCRNWCKERHCYTVQGRGTFRCEGGTSQTRGGTFLQAALAFLIVARILKDRE
jgi:hypothetical protein